MPQRRVIRRWNSNFRKIDNIAWISTWFGKNCGFSINECTNFLGSTGIYLIIWSVRWFTYFVGVTILCIIDEILIGRSMICRREFVDYKQCCEDGQYRVIHLKLYFLDLRFWALESNYTNFHYVFIHFIAYNKTTDFHQILWNFQKCCLQCSAFFFFFEKCL